ncbi:MAG: hypothetical protein KatS3mg076_0997 [Candidatus Binatia bacterium]|nr:MAG: hypothetical protein KatS3mg076_0997 [Candidatus Binatia bacterium]
MKLETKTPGFTIVELLVALGVFLTLAALVTGGVRPQAKSATAQVRLAQMQMGARAAFDLLARDVRMAGYGVASTMPGSPPPLELADGTLSLYANFSNVKTKGSGQSSSVTVLDSTGFAVGNYLTISSAWGGEAHKITGVSGNVISLDSSLSRNYPAGSDVAQIEEVRYRLSNGVLLRNDVPLAEGVELANFGFYLDDETLVSDPTGVEARVRSLLLDFKTHALHRPAGTSGEDIHVTAEVRIRNLGLAEVERST